MFYDDLGTDPKVELRSVLEAFSPINDNAYSFSNILQATSSIDNNDNNFAFYDLQLLEGDFDLLNKLQLSEDYNVHITDLKNFENGIYNYLEKSLIGDSSILIKFKDLISKVLTNITKNFNVLDSEIKFLAHNVTSDNNFFPTWHIDKFVFKEAEHSKNIAEKIFIVSFKGPSTLYQMCNNDCREHFIQIANETSKTYGYSISLLFQENSGLDALFHINQSYSAVFGEGSIHNPGLLNGTIHSSSFGLARFIMITTLKIKLE